MQRRREARTAAALGALLWMAAAVLAGGQSLSDAAVKSGVRVFRAVLAGDEDILAKKAGGKLVVLAVTATAAGATPDLGAQLFELWGGASAAVKDVPLEVRPVAVAALAAQAGPVAGVIVAEPMGDDAIRRLNEFAAQRKVIVYSPFEGDVERGLPSGCAIEAKVQPFFNARSLRESKVRIRPKLLGVAKIHE